MRQLGLVSDNWISYMHDQGERVGLYRDYYDGFHPQRYSPEMRRLLQLDVVGDNSDGGAGQSYRRYSLFDSFNANYCDMVVNSMADRLAIERIEPAGDLAGNDKAQDWIDAVFEHNRIDALQIDVHVAALRDGVAWVMVDWDAEARLPRLVFESAYDDYIGVAGVYDTTGAHLAAAVKVWGDGDTNRMANLYLPEGMERFPADRADGEGDDGAQYLGIPLVPFGGDSRSELANVVPLQKVLNDIVASLDATALRSGFPIYVSKQLDIPQNMAPGQIIQAAILNIHGEPEVPDNNEHAKAMAAMLNASGLEKIDAGDIATLAHAADFFISQISTISSTPVPAGMGGDSQSGEALKQREVRLLGKIRRFHVQGGNNWEDVMRMANQYQRAYGGQGVPEIDAFTVRWVNPELRNDMEIRERAKLVHEWGLTREALRLLSLSSDINYSEDDIDRLLEEQAEDVNQRLPQAGAPGVPQFGDCEEEAGLDDLAAPPQDEVLA